MIQYTQCSVNDPLLAHRMIMGIEMSQIVTTDLGSLSLGLLSYLALLRISIIMKIRYSNRAAGNFLFGMAYVDVDKHNRRNIHPLSVITLVVILEGS